MSIHNKFLPIRVLICLYNDIDMFSKLLITQLIKYITNLKEGRTLESVVIDICQAKHKRCMIGMPLI